MKATILKKASLENLPSASGVEIIDGIIYIVGDDSPYLYVLDHSLKLLEKIELFETKDFDSGRIPKKIKPDLECLTTVTINNNNHILLLGSGSKDNRDKGYLVKLPTKYNRKHFVTPVSLSSLYNLLQSNPEIVGEGKLNLEAAATTDSHIILFNRANRAGVNSVLYFHVEEFIVYLTENPDLVPFPVIYKYELPPIEGVPSGFSGASVMSNKLFFTAAAEDTSDAVEDGAVTGSLIGWIDIWPVEYIRGGNMHGLSPIKDFAVIEDVDGSVYKGKVESISMYEMDSDTQFVALAITDDDKGGSELLMVEIKL